MAQFTDRYGTSLSTTKIFMSCREEESSSGGQNQTETPTTNSICSKSTHVPSSLSLCSSLRWRRRLIWLPYHHEEPHSYRWSQNPFTTPLIFVLTITLLFSNVLGSPTEPELVCQKGVSGFAGATFPKGDILLQEGDTLEVYCRLNLSLSRGHNASSIKFMFTRVNISEEVMKTTVINETTAMLRVERMNVSSPHLSCEIAPQGVPYSKFIQVCQNEIDVGYPPLPVEDFRCLAKDWRSLNCTWKKPYNPIPTTYKLQMITTIRKTYKSITPCPNSTATPTSCVWGPRTDPFYRPNQKTLELRINGTNVLYPSGINWTFIIDHWSIVVPEKPLDLKEHKVSETNSIISWTFKNFKDFDPGLEHEIKICIQNITEVPCNTSTIKSSKGTVFMEHNLLLQYAYVNYTVEIRMRSGNHSKAKNEKDFWSDPATIVVTSEPRVPALPPRVDAGSYETVTMTLKHRDIYLYWEEVPRLLQSGPDFHYVFSVYEDEEERRIFPEEITKSYAKFTKQGAMRSYRFYIKSANSVGNSSTSSSIFVPKNNKAPGQPLSVSKLDFTNGSFEVSWQHPTNSDVPIVSYTVFRCISSKPRPYQCQGLLKWDVISSSDLTRKVYNYLPNHNEKIYQFAVSANAKDMSSGMIWASCTLIHNRVPEKLRKVDNLFQDEREIHISWQLDCSYQPGVIDGFKITYCLVNILKHDRCAGDEKSGVVIQANETTYRLKELKPNSMYMIAVSVMTRAGDSQKSDPIFAHTKESAPSDSPIANVAEVTNTSARVEILPLYTENGIIQEYKIKYKSIEDFEEEVEVSVPINLNDTNLSNATLIEAVIKNLSSDAKYSFTVSACTVRCSEESQPVYFKTNIGHTNIKASPSIASISNGRVVLEWQLPNHLGGPIKNFEILLNRNGKEPEIVSVDFLEGTKNYQEQLKFSCEANENSTALVRAVTELETGELIYGDWSPPAKIPCGGGITWLMWIFVVIASAIALGLLALGSTKVYHYVKQMKEFDVKLPPGLAVQDLNGFSHKHPKRMRKNSDGDTHSFGKENLTYQLQMTSTHHSDESKDLSSLTESCLREKKTEFSSELDTKNDDDQKMCPQVTDSRESHKKSDSNCNIVLVACVGPELSSPESPPSNNNAQVNVESPAVVLLPVPVVTEQSSSELQGNGQDSLMDEKRLSPSPTNPLLDESQLTDDDDTLQAHLDMCDEVQKQQDFCNVLGNGTCSKINPSEELPNNSYANSSVSATNTFELPPLAAKSNFNVPPDVLAPINNGNSSTVNSFPHNNSTIVNISGPTMPSSPYVASPYVKWTQMIPEQFRNGDSSSIGNSDNGRRPPYCQVGILLDSN